MATEMRFGLRVPLCASPQEISDLILQAEVGGFDYAWLPDSQTLWRDVWVNLGLVGARTSKILLGTNVINPLTRHVTVTASAAATVAELTGGRFVLGIGSGDSSVRVMGWRTARISQLREYISLLRPLWEGQFVSPYDRPFRLQATTGHRIPIYVSATGPNMLQFAGEVADGVILLAGIAPDSLDYALRNLEIGAKRAGRRVEDIDVAVGTFCYITDNWRAVKKLAQPYAALYAFRHPEAMRDTGIVLPERQDVSGIYPDLSHAEDWDRAVELTNWLPDDVLEAFCERFCLMGTGEEVASRIQALATSGVNNLYIRGFYSYRLPTDVAETFIREVIPRFR